MATEFMTSHRATNEGEWRSISPELWTPGQRLAEATHGVMTLANAITIIGGGLVVSGINDLKNGEYVDGIIKIGAGRIADIADGYVSHALGTKSPVGEAADAGVDTLLTFYAAYKLRDLKIIPDEFAYALLAQQSANTALTGVAKLRGREIHTGASGKLSQSEKWAAIGLYAISHMTETKTPDEIADQLRQHGQYATENLALSVEELDFDAISQVTRQAAYVLAVGGVVTGLVANGSYAKQALFAR
jgi:phosphatidylglycerophosphate synthase